MTKKLLPSPMPPQTILPIGTTTMIKAYARWSIYVRTSSIEKLKKVHLPVISNGLQPLEFEWQIVKGDENPGLFRVINCQNLSANTLQGIIVPLLKRAYSLADG